MDPNAELVPPAHLTDRDAGEWVWLQKKRHGTKIAERLLDMARKDHVTGEHLLTACLAVAASVINPSSRLARRAVSVASKLATVKPKPSARGFSYAIRTSVRRGLLPETHEIVAMLLRHDIPISSDVHAELLKLYCEHGMKSESLDLWNEIYESPEEPRNWAVGDATSTVLASEQLALTFAEASKLFDKMTACRSRPTPIMWLGLSRAAGRHPEQQPRLSDAIFKRMADHQLLPTHQQYAMLLESLVQSKGLDAARRYAAGRDLQCASALRCLEEAQARQS
ncbi:hypothetical protein DIPPA_14074 [Diplonema papillatum]|nr:hypothetical protein DIPPA_14074 [Diplonema papillatum]